MASTMRTLVLILLFIVALSAAASDRIPIQSEVLKYKYQAVVNRRLLQGERLNSLGIAYRQLEQEIQVTTADLLKVRSEVYASQELKEEEYDIDVDAGEFVLKPKDGK